MRSSNGGTTAADLSLECDRFVDEVVAVVAVACDCCSAEKLTFDNQLAPQTTAVPGPSTEAERRGSKSIPRIGSRMSIIPFAPACDRGSDQGTKRRVEREKRERAFVGRAMMRVGSTESEEGRNERAQGTWDEVGSVV